MENVEKKGAFEGWRSPDPPVPTPLIETSKLPNESEVNGNDIKVNGNEEPPSRNLHPSLHQTQSDSQPSKPPVPEASGHHQPPFQPRCEYSTDEHSHAVDLMTLHLGHQHDGNTANQPSYHVPSSVPAQSYLSGSRPPTVPAGNGNGAPPKSRRMSSSTSLARGKSAVVGWDGRPAAMNHSASYTGNSAGPRRPSNAGNVGPALYDFGKTDRRPSQSGSRPMPMNGRAAPVGRHVAASLPVRSELSGRPRISVNDDMDFNAQSALASDDDERSGSAEMEFEMEIEGENPDSNPLALGTGSGGIKGRRKGQKFVCETCGKDYMHPGCLRKHRWEHSPSWQDPSMINMSKHAQVEMLEAAAILFAPSLPKDRSLWPSVVSETERRSSFSKSPASSNAALLTPSSLREPSSFGAMSERHLSGKERKSSPGSDSTTSSMGAGDALPGATYRTSSVAGGLGLSNGNGNGYGNPNNNRVHPSAQYPVASQVQRIPSAPRVSRAPSFTNSHQYPSSLPDMGTLQFHAASPIPTHGASPIPHRYPLGGMSLQSRTGMIGGGMFGNGGGGFHTTARSSSVRSGAADLPEADEEEDLVQTHRGSSSSEEAEDRRKGDKDGDEWEMADGMDI